MSFASKHGEEAIGQDMHWCEAQLSLGFLGASEVTQEPVLPLEGFVLEYCLTLASLRETGTSEEKGKSSHVPGPVVGLHCYLLPLWRRYAQICCSWEHSFLDWHKDRLTRFYQHQQPERSHQHMSGNNTGLLRLISTLVDFPVWMYLLATTLAQR